MRDSWKLMLGVSAVLVVAWAAEAGAALVVYGDRAAFEAALTHVKTYTFEVSDGFPQAPPVSGPGTPPALTGWDGMQFSGFGDAPPTVQYRRDLDEFSPPNQFLAGVRSVRFSAPQRGIGLDAVAWEVGVPNALVTLRFADTSETRSFTLRGVTAWYFFGAISDDPIVGLDIDPNAPGLGDHYYMAGIDNLSMQAIPEPGLFMMLALAGSAMLAKRRRY